EMWDTSYDIKNLRDLAPVENPKTLKFLMDIAIRYNVNVVGGSIPFFEKGNIYNTSFVFNREGKPLGVYRKIHLFGLMGEDKTFARGRELCLFDLEGVKCGLIICYDLRFPELIRTLALKGAQIIFVPAQWPAARIAHWRILLQARAIENQCYVIGVNRCGKEGDLLFNGNSLVVDPWGDIIAGGTDVETVIFAELELSRVKEVRGIIPVFDDRAPEVYEIS
ncbi:MAG: carbon-nitrogen family hydrolase, partial [Synergistetes bacterium]|nr:carbon-nitrogen family hydrolase [Synergistota bacterium]MDW8191795.1 carbon-nitrogen family hydrolase [Synergistota bacterium]